MEPSNTSNIPDDKEIPNEITTKKNDPNDREEIKNNPLYQKLADNQSGGMEFLRDKNMQDLTKPRVFWDTQPVPKFSDVEQTEEFKEGEIETEKDLEKERKIPYPLLDQFDWADIDLTNAEHLDDVYKFLSENYVEDDDNMFRFDYSKDFLKWSLTPPGYFPEWIIGVRVKKSGKLVGFITGIPVTAFANKNKIKMAEINYLCVHKKLRANRLAPVLIKEVTRRVHTKNQWQAIYTAGVLIPTPIAQAKYFHRSLNPKKLVDVHFSSLPPKQTISMMVRLYKLPEEPLIKGIRPMKTKDIDGVYKLLSTFLEKFAIHLRFTQEDIKHWFMPIKNVIYSYVVENENKQITDFCSFYCLPSSILRNPKYDLLKAAYSYYNVATSVPFKDLMQDALILANNEEFDVFNCLNIMDNEEILKDLKFSQGDGNLHYYLYNWRLNKPLAPKDIGIVLL